MKSVGGGERKEKRDECQRAWEGREGRYPAEIEAKMGWSMRKGEHLTG